MRILSSGLSLIIIVPAPPPAPMAVSVVLVGAGGVGETHAEHLVEVPEAELVAVCDLERDRAETVAEAADARAYTDYREALGEERPEAVYLTTPPGSRVEIVRTIAEHGAAILCEKPLAATVADGREIAGIVADRGIPFMVGFCSRFAEPLQRLRGIVADGGVGDPVALFSTRTGWGVPEGDDWRTTPGEACGIAVESTAHNVDVLRWLGGEIDHAAGATTNVTHPELETFDDNAVAHLTFESGAIGTVLNSWTSHIEGLRHGVIGTEGSAVVAGDGWWRLDRLEHATADGTDVVEFDDEVATEMGYRGETEAFVESVSEEAEPPVTVADGLRALELCHAIRS